MGELALVTKLADGSAVEAWLGRQDHFFHLVQRCRPELLAQRELYLRFLAVSQAASGVQHPEVLSVHQFMRGQDGRVWAVSDAISGWTAADLLQRKGRVPEALAAEWALATCEGLEVLHAAGRLHGCLAPRHLHVHGDPASPQVRLLDTTLLHFRGKNVSLPLREGAVLVEPEYLSPERALGSRCTVAGDVWGVGILLVELLTGRNPFRGKNEDDSRRKVLAGGTVTLPAPLARWQSLIDACLDPSPDNRLGSALEIRQALLGVMGEASARSAAPS